MTTSVRHEKTLVTASIGMASSQSFMPMIVDNIRHVMRRKALLLYCVLFAVTYGICLWQFIHATQISTPAAVVRQESPQASVPSITASTPPVTRGASLENAAQVTASLPQASPAEIAPEQIAMVREASATVIASEDISEKAQALRQLSEAPTIDTLQALTTTLQTDTIPRNRLLAINALRLLGLQGDTDGRIRSRLQAAANDPDANVANTAQDALQQLDRSRP